MQVYS